MPQETEIDLQSRFQAVDRRVAAVGAARQKNTDDLAAANKARTDAEDKLNLFNRVTALYKHVIDLGLKQSFQSIEMLVTEGLTTVYGEKRLRMKITPVERRGQYNVDITTLDDIRQLEGPTEDTFGGAVVQLESFLLRIVFLLQTKMIPFALLDESFNCVSAGYLGNLADLLRELCKKFDLDILLVTHQQEMREAADCVFEVIDSKDGLKLK